LETELLIELHYFPCLDFFAAMSQCSATRLEAHEQYQKQSLRNRCYVLTANKIDCLTVPVLGPTRHQPIRDVRIDNDQKWRERHWRCLEGAYRKAPFFEFYAPDLEPVFAREYPFLFDLNLELLTICRKWIGLTTPLGLTNCYEKQPAPGVFDARNRVDAQSGLFYSPIPYSQNFGVDFVPNLSILDVVFNQGPESSRFTV
jgi:WbqC-like protein family